MYSVGFLITSLGLAKIMGIFGWKAIHVSAFIILVVGHLGILMAHYWITGL